MFLYWLSQTIPQNSAHSKWDSLMIRWILSHLRSQSQTRSISRSMNKSLHQGKGNHSQTRRQPKKQSTMRPLPSVKKNRRTQNWYVSTVMFTCFSNSLDCGHQDIIVEGCCFWTFYLLFKVIIYSVHSFILICLIWGWGWNFLFLWQFEPEKMRKHSWDVLKTTDPHPGYVLNMLLKC